MFGTIVSVSALVQADIQATIYRYVYFKSELHTLSQTFYYMVVKLETCTRSATQVRQGSLYRHGKWLILAEVGTAIRPIQLLAV